MSPIVRNVLAVIAGFIVGSFVNMALIQLGAQVVPPPAEFLSGDMAAMKAAAQALEPRHFVFPFLAHAGGTFVGAFLVHVLAGSARAALGYALGAFFLLGGIMAATMIPAPAWFIALDLCGAYLPMAWLANRLGARVKAGKT